MIVVPAQMREQYMAKAGVMYPVEQRRRLLVA
jgi:hypothetical protein